MVVMLLDAHLALLRSRWRRNRMPFDHTVVPTKLTLVNFEAKLRNYFGIEWEGYNEMGFDWYLDNWWNRSVKGLVLDVVLG